MANAAPFQPLVPQQQAGVPQYPTLEDFMAAQNGKPVRFCWKLTNGQTLANDPGGWTAMSAAQPTHVDQHIIFIFCRHSGLPDEPERQDAANALIAIRLHQILRYQNQSLQGNTLLILTDMDRECAFEMPAYSFDHSTRQFFGFPQTMERLSQLYANADNPKKPIIWLVSRSMSSLTCKIPQGWFNFLHRQLFAPLHQQLQVVYQVPQSWPAPDPMPVGPRAVPWHHDTLLPIKLVELPLLDLVGGRPNEPAWYSTIRTWLREEDLARTDGVPQDRAIHISTVRGRGRLQVEP